MEHRRHRRSQAVTCSRVLLQPHPVVGLKPELYLRTWFLLGQGGAGCGQQSLVIGSLGWGGVWTFGTRWLLLVAVL